MQLGYNREAMARQMRERAVQWCGRRCGKRCEGGKPAEKPRDYIHVTPEALAHVLVVHRGPAPPSHHAFPIIALHSPYSHISSHRANFYQAAMGKRKNQSEERRKRFKQDADAQLSTGVFNNADDDDWIEQNYQVKVNDVVESLPIKKLDGTVERVIRQKQEPVKEEIAEEEDKEQEQEPEVPVTQEESDISEEFNGSPQAKLVQMKEEIADLASRLTENPEENILSLTRLRKMAHSKNFVLSQLAIVSLVPVFKSLAPGYKIRQLTDTEKREKVSKDVAKLRAFEQALIYNYKLYIDLLYQLSKVTRSNASSNKKATETHIKLGQLALKASCELLQSSLKYFNYRDELISIVIKRLNKKPQDVEDFNIFTKCVRVIESLLMDDEEHGELTMDVVRILYKSITTKKFRVDESVLNILLSLSLLDDYTPPDLRHDSATEKKFKVDKKNRVHLSKKQKKARKELKEIEKEMEKAQQTVTAEERQKYQAQTLQTTLKLYLEILKHRSTNKDAMGLMSSVLEGLSKFGRMANFDLLGDFLEVLREIMSDIIDAAYTGADDVDSVAGTGFTSTDIRSVLLCIMTAFQLLFNHMELSKISVDLSHFINGLYLVLGDVGLDADVEFSSKSLRLMDPLTSTLDKPAVNVSTKAELLLHSLDSVFFRSKNGSRVGAFVKRLYMMMLHTPEKTSLATLKFVGKMMSKYSQTASLYDTEDRSGDGRYILGTEVEQVELERSNAEAATLWENVLLDKHYAVMVRDGSRSLLKQSKKSR